MDLVSINSVFALFDCVGAILYELLIAELMDQVYQSDAYEDLPGVLVNMGGGRYLFQRNRGKRPTLWGTRTIFGNREHTKTHFRFEGKGNTPIYFRGTMEHIP